MSITINIYYTGKDDNALKFAKEMIQKGYVKEIRNTPGNLRYEYFVPLESDELFGTSTILLIDSWEDQSALDKHHASKMMEIISDLRVKYDLKMQVERFISDDEIPEGDEKFIRT